MKIKLRLMPILISVIASSVLLFGGWFAYNSLALNNPLTKIVQDATGVTDANTQVSNDQIMIELNLAKDANLREIMQHIKTEGQSIIKDRKLNVSVTNVSSTELDQWWSTALFDVAQAMETKQYGNIPEALHSRQAHLSGLELTTEMDQDNIYITLHHEGSSKYIMLPRAPTTLGVWGS